MTVRIMTGNRPRLLLASLLLGCGMMNASDELAAAAVATPVDKAVETTNSSGADEISRLKAQLAEQQKQLQALQESIQAQQKLLEKVLAAPSGTMPAQMLSPARLGEVASMTPVVPPAPAPAVAMPAQKQPSNPTGGGNPCEASLD